MAKRQNDRFCAFCGRQEGQVRTLLSSPIANVFICDECAESAHNILEETAAAEKEENFDIKKEELPKPKEIKEFLDEYVIGQDDAKKYLSVAV